MVLFLFFLLVAIGWRAKYRFTYKRRFEGEYAILALSHILMNLCDLDWCYPLWNPLLHFNPSPFGGEPSWMTEPVCEGMC